MLVVDPALASVTNFAAEASPLRAGSVARVGIVGIRQDEYRRHHDRLDGFGDVVQAWTPERPDGPRPPPTTGQQHETTATEWS